jgi:hypothetical protein
MLESSISGYMLNAPITNESYEILKNLFDQTDKECQEIGEQFINDAKTKGKDFTDKFSQNTKVKNYLNVLNFFNSNKILKEAEVMLYKFEGFINKIE